MDMPIILLAAGQSRRMRGMDKLMKRVAGQPLIRRQAAMARGVTSGAVIVALPPPPHPRHDALAGLDVERVAVPDADEGMNASLRHAVAAVPPDAKAVMLVLADLVDLRVEDLRRVAQSVDLSSDKLIWRGATEAGEPGHPIVFAAALFPDIARLSGDGGAKRMVAATGDKIVLVPLPGDRARRDLDTPEDWEIWRAGRTAQ